MTPEERKKMVRDLADEVESDVSYRISAIVSDAVSDAVEDALCDLEVDNLASSVALAFMCQTDPENQEFSRINIDKAKMNDLLTRASSYIASVGDFGQESLKRRIP